MAGMDSGIPDENLACADLSDNHSQCHRYYVNIIADPSCSPFFSGV